MEPTGGFTKEYGRTLNYTLGAPRSFRVSGKGDRVFYLRSASAFDRNLDLWTLRTITDNTDIPAESRLVGIKDLVRPNIKIAEPALEISRRERVPESATGITAYSISEDGSVVAFAVAGDIYICYTRTGEIRAFAGSEQANEVQVAPDGSTISFLRNRELYLSRIEGGTFSVPTRISPASQKYVSWGIADFIAAEEMHRSQGYWWAPNSRSVLFAGVDDSEVNHWYISNPTDPNEKPRSIRYPQAGTANAKLSMFWWSVESPLLEIKWDNQSFPYVVGVSWKGNEPTLIVQHRTQRRVVVLNIDPYSGETIQVYEKTDDLWVELIHGVPFWSQNQEIVDAPDNEIRRLKVGGEFISPENLEVRRVIGQASSGAFLYLASPVNDARETHVWATDPEIPQHVQVSRRPGVFSAALGGNTVVVLGISLDDRPHLAEVAFIEDLSGKRIPISDNAAPISIEPRPIFHRTRVRELDYAVLYPCDYRGNSMLPVLMDPYGGPWLQRCVKSSLSYTVSQWFANHGFAVIVGDGRGTPGRGRDWEKAISGDLISKPLEDQMQVLDDALERAPLPLDPNKVAIRGWSFGGYLSILAVLLRPDRIHAAVAGAPVTDWRYYDTHYAERYLGFPDHHPNSYDHCSALVPAASLTRPLLLIHGLNDDNVVVGHTFRLSQALFLAGREHYVLPLTDVTHMTSSEPTTEYLLELQLTFIRRALGLK